MHKSVSGISSVVFLLLSTSAAMAEEQSADGRRLALAVPRAKAQTVPVPVRSSIPRAASISPSDEFASHAPLTFSSKEGQATEAVKDVLVESAQKAEQISRSSNRRVADLIVWIINSMKDSKTFTPASGPYLQQAAPVQFAPSAKPQNSSIFQID